MLQQGSPKERLSFFFPSKPRERENCASLPRSVICWQKPRCLHIKCWNNLLCSQNHVLFIVVERRIDDPQAAFDLQFYISNLSWELCACFGWSVTWTEPASLLQGVSHLKRGHSSWCKPSTWIKSVLACVKMQPSNTRSTRFMNDLCIIMLVLMIRECISIPWHLSIVGHELFFSFSPWSSSYVIQDIKACHCFQYLSSK